MTEKTNDRELLLDRIREVLGEELGDSFMGATLVLLTASEEPRKLLISTTTFTREQAEGQP